MSETLIEKGECEAGCMPTMNMLLAAESLSIISLLLVNVAMQVGFIFIVQTSLGNFSVTVVLGPTQTNVQL